MKDLISAAIEARIHAHAPYSNFLVGAAVLTKSGKIFTGCNIENASFSLTCCAERVAAASAISQGQRELEAIAVVSTTGAYPCGACRQFLSEFAPELLIIISDHHGKCLAETTLDAIFPEAFDRNSLNP